MINSTFRCLGALLIFSGVICFGQNEHYQYKRHINGIQNQWHSIEIPSETFVHLQENYADIRIFGVTETNDTIAAPYVLTIEKDQHSRNAAKCKIINPSSIGDNHYSTIEVPSKAAINSIELSFGNDNFDWQVQLAGSQDQKTWFTILDNYRILSIKNKSTNYAFTTLNFPEAKYQYFRIQIEAKSKPVLKNSSVHLNKSTKASKIVYPLKNFAISENKKKQQTVLAFELEEKVPVHFLQVVTQNKYDYYRPIDIEYLRNVTQTEKGAIENYRSIYKGTLSSLNHNPFRLEEVVAKQFRITISNYDNQALDFSGVQLSGYKHVLQIRFDRNANYYFTYGNETAKPANYDITKFKNNIPDNIKTLSLGPIELIKSVKSNFSQDSLSNKSFLDNPIILYSVLLIIMLLLGGFSISMIRKS